MWGTELRKEQAGFLQQYDTTVLKAKDAMKRPVLLYEEDTVEKILKKLKKEDVNSCFVVTKEKKLLGIISDEDIITLFMEQVKNEPLVQILNRGYRREFRYKTAKDLLKKHLVVKPETPINEVIKMLKRAKFSYLPVIDKSEKVIGAITPSSVINLLKKY